MKLSVDTLSVLKNFASINQGIMFKKGKTLRTVSAQKNVMAEATVSDEFPTDFGVYDLNNFLSVLSLHKEEPTIDFQDNNVLISGLQGRSKIKYRFCAPGMLVAAPDKAITMPDAEISFELKAEDLANMWQGVMPSIAMRAEVEDVILSHKNNIFEFFHGQGLPQNVKFMIFKAKKRAEINYYKMTAKTTDDGLFPKIGVGRRQSPYSFNWPYDYCSLVETAKIDIDLEYTNISGSNV